MKRIVFVLTITILIVFLAIETKNYFLILKYKSEQTEEMKKKSSEYEKSLQKFVECAGFRSINLIIKPGDDSFFTHIDGLNTLVWKKVSVIVGIKRFEKVIRNI